MTLTSSSQWIIYRKLDKKWAFLHNGHPAGQIEEDLALKALNTLLDKIQWHEKEECSEYIVWKFKI